MYLSLSWCNNLKAWPNKVNRIRRKIQPLSSKSKQKEVAATDRRIMVYRRTIKINDIAHIHLVKNGCLKLTRNLLVFLETAHILHLQEECINMAKITDFAIHCLPICLGTCQPDMFRESHVETQILECA
ncbi:UNVERIFIED_CONTAM: hypothetical protein K2H54_027177 [Gekko kuhli]